MKNNTKVHLKGWKLLIPVLVSVVLCVSCREDYFYDEQEPEWLGQSIYNFLVEEGNYSYFIKLIDDLGYTEVLSKTGSKTLFVVDDETFMKFFDENEWKVKSYEELTLAQKEQLLYSSMLNNVFFSEMLGDASGPQEGLTVRRTSALSMASTLTKVHRSQFPESYYWNLVGNDSVYLLKDNTAAPMVNFAYSYMINNALKGSDYAFISNQASDYVYQGTDVFVNGVRIVEANLKCKNGVVHRMERMVTPLTNMADMICNNDSTKRFAELLDRFSAPFPSKSATDAYGNGTPVYVKKYFTTRGHSTGLDGFNNATNVEFMTTPTDSVVEAGLKFDPGWNTLTASDIKPMNEDMSAIFVPTDKALDDFLYNGGGKFLYDRYGNWDSIPNHVLADLLNNHMKSSFVNSVPSKFDQVKNDAQIDMGVKMEDVKKAALCCNGVIYYTDKVYVPVSYSAVTAPTLVNDNMRVMRWAVEKYGFLAYLHSMDSYYSFILPTDENFVYLDPVSVAKGNPEYWKFKYNEDHKAVEVDVLDSLGFKIRSLQAWGSGSKEIQNRLEDLIDQHIIVDDVETPDKRYYLTKGNGTVKVMPSTTDGLDFFGGYQLENNSSVNVPQGRISPGGNGKAYITSALVQSPLQSVHSAIKAQAGDQNAPFSKFYNLMIESGVFNTDDTYAISDEYTVDIFNTYHYTIYVPSNEAITNAINNGLPTLSKANEWLASLETELGKTLDGELKQVYLDSISNILHDFVCYHIHDNSVFIGGAPVSNREFQTGSLDMSENLFRRLTVNANSSTLTVTDAAHQTHNVNVVANHEGVLYNIMTRDYMFNDGVSGTNSETKPDLDITKSKEIETSSFAVIHAIDGEVLLYDENQYEKYAKDVERIQRSFRELIK